MEHKGMLRTAARVFSFKVVISLLLINSFNKILSNFKEFNYYYYYVLKFSVHIRFYIEE